MFFPFFLSDMFLFWVCFMETLYVNASCSPPSAEQLLAEKYYGILCYTLLFALVGMIDRVGLA